MEAIEAEVTDGFGFIPLVGAGLSAPSGVPVIQELVPYLHKCVAMALGITNPAVDQAEKFGNLFPFHESRRWRPGRDSWPPFGDPQIYSRETTDWRERIQKSVDFIRTHKQRETCLEFAVFEESIGAMAEWRSTLLFLSRLISDTNKDHSEKIRLGPVDQDVIDSFFLNVVYGKAPTLGHRMLARLSAALRIDLTLTTNVDDLLETSFDEIGDPLTEFHVQINAELPPFRQLQGRNCLVKLHGGRHGLRADYSLDARPNDDDIRHFSEYLAARPITRDEWAVLIKPNSGANDSAAGSSIASGDDNNASTIDVGGASSFIAPRKHLLVIGCSGREERILKLIEEADARINGQSARPPMSSHADFTPFQVYWLCFNKKDVDQANKALSQIWSIDGYYNSLRQYPLSLDANKRDGTSSEPLKPLRRPVHIIRVQFPGLFFLHLYQVLTKSLPESGALFPSTPRLPVPPECSEEHLKALNVTDSVAATIRAKIHDNLNACFADRARRLPLHRLIVVHGKEGQFRGAMSIAGQVFDQQIEDGRQAVWIDMDDILGPDDLFETLMHTVARKAGINDWLPVLIQLGEALPPAGAGAAPGDDTKRFQEPQNREIRRLTNNPNREWVLFLNARSGVGSSFDSGSATSPNGWMDTLPAEQAATIALIRRITGPDCPNVCVVVLCHNGPFLNAVTTGITDNAVNLDELAQLDAASHGSPAESTPAVPSNVINPVDAALDWITDTGTATATVNEPRSRFLLAMVLANRTRYLSLLWSRAFHANADSIAERCGNTTKWVDELERLHVVRRKRGGFFWLMSRVRNEIRAKLENSNDSLQIAEVHRLLAEWYRRLLLAGDESGAGFEVAYHRLQEVRTRLSLSLDYDQRDRILEALAEARQALTLARPRMLATGFSKGVCRKLEWTRTVLTRDVSDRLDHIIAAKECAEAVYLPIKKWIHSLYCDTLQLNLAIAREVGEVGTALRRHRHWHANVIVNPQHGSIVSDAESLPFKTTSQLPQDVAPAVWLAGMCEVVILAVAARAYERSRELLNAIYTAVAFDSVQALIAARGPTVELHAGVREWLAVIAEMSERRQSVLVHEKEEYRQQFVEGVIDTLQRDIQLRLAEGQVLHLLARRVGKPEQRVKANTEAKICFNRATRCHEAGIELLRWQNTDGIRADRLATLLRAPRDDHYHWLDDRQRFDTQVAIAHAYLDDFHKAHRRLNDAEAAAAKMGGRRDRLETAIISLHRVEVLTLQAVYRTPPLGSAKDAGAMHDLSEMRHGVLQCFHASRKTASSSDGDPSPDRDAEVFRQMTVVLSNEVRPLARYRHSLASLDDAWLTLNGAERILEYHRKNVWWTGWAFVLRLKLIELRVFSVLRALKTKDERRPTEFDLTGEIPFLGVQSAPYGTPTLPDRLLDNTERLVRLDVFRLAQAVESYSHMLWALALWRVVLYSNRDEKYHREADVLQERQEMMCNRLTEFGEMKKKEFAAVPLLEAKLTDRGPTWSVEKNGRDELEGIALSDAVGTYCMNVIRRAKEIVKRSKGIARVSRDVAEARRIQRAGKAYLDLHGIACSTPSVPGD